jgi:hypothetical protein
VHRRLQVGKNGGCEYDSQTEHGLSADAKLQTAPAAHLGPSQKARMMEAIGGCEQKHRKHPAKAAG